jgi:hypothetical protein
VEANAPFVPWQRFSDYMHECDDCISLTRAAPVKASTLLNCQKYYEAFIGKYGQRKDDVANEEDSNDSAEGLDDWDFPDLFVDAGRKHGAAKEAVPPIDETAAARKRALASRIKLSELATKKLRDELDASGGHDDEPEVKRPRTTSYDDVDHTTDFKGLDALTRLKKSFCRSIEEGLYIDFSSVDSRRLDAVAMLGAAAGSSRKLGSNLILTTSASAADIPTETTDLEAIRRGFFSYYLKALRESSFGDAHERADDRANWWSQVEELFSNSSHAAYVLFIQRFVLKHSAKAMWAPLVDMESNMVSLAKEKHPLLKKDSKKDPPSTPSGKGKGGKGGKGSRLTAAQLAKMADMRNKHPGICLSRIFKGMPCPRERKKVACAFTHVCIYCNVKDTCAAACATAQTL